MPIATPRATRRPSSRRLAGAAIAVAALTGSLLTAQSASAVGDPTSTVPSLSSLSTWHEWVDPSGFDYGLAAGPHGTHPASLRMSNSIPTANYGVITQLSSPAIAEVGESGTTDADYRVFTAEFTLDAESYLAQPGLAVEVSGDQGGNRSGGSIVFRHDSDNVLTLSTYWADAGSPADLADWNNDTANVPFSAPVKIRYVAEYNDAAPDSVKVYVNDILTISGQGYEAYHAAVGSDPQVIDSLLFRTSRNEPVLGGAWNVVEPTVPQKAAILGHGFFFNGIEYEASNVAIAPSAAIVVQPTITGSAAVTSVLTANVSTNVIAPTLSYRWLREGLSIAGASGSTYTLGANDVNKRISVQVTASKAGYTSGTATSTKTAPVSAATLVFSTPATITGTLKLGSTVTADGATTPGATYSYQWYRNGAAIKGATAKTYKLGASDVDRSMSVKVTATKAGYATLASTSASSSLVQPGTLVVGTVSIGGTLTVGRNLNARSGTWTPGTTLKYAYYADGELVQFSASKTFRLTWEEVGKSITLIVIGSMRGYDKAESAETAPRGPVGA
jgi:hypothetical protein